MGGWAYAGNQAHGVMTFIALLAGAVGLVYPLLHGLTTLYGMEHRKMYPLLRGVDRAGPNVLPGGAGGASVTMMRH